MCVPERIFPRLCWFCGEQQESNPSHPGEVPPEKPLEAAWWNCRYRWVSCYVGMLDGCYSQLDYCQTSAGIRNCGDME